MVPALGIGLAATLIVMIFWSRHLGALMQIASLLAALLLMIWLQENGYLGGTGARPSIERPVSQDGRP